MFFNKLILKDVHILYSPKDTLLSCQKMSVSFSASELVKLKISLNKVKLDNGVFNLINETKGSTNLDRIFNSKPKKKATTSKPIDIQAKELQLTNFRFTLQNKFSESTKYGSNYINFSDLDVYGININLKRIHISRDTLFANLENLQCIDKSGFRINKLKGELAISSTEARINNCYIDDSHTKITAGHFSMFYSSIKDFSHFTEKVKMEIDLQNSYLNFSTVGKITPDLSKNKLGLYATGLISGTVSNLSTKGLKITSESGLTHLNLDAKITGLPKSQEAMTFIDINDCSTTSLDIAYIISSINSSKPIDIIRNLSPLVKYDFKGGLAGLLTDFVAKGNLSSNIGSVDFDLLLRKNKSSKGMDLIGKLRTNEFNLGMLIQNSKLGALTLSSKVTSLLRDKQSGGNKFIIDSINIKKIEFNGYNYQNIQAVGSLDDTKFDGKIICHDPNLDFIFQGLFGFSKESNSYYDFYADVVYADLAALNLDKRDSISSIQFKTLANFTKSTKGDIIGDIDVRGLNFTNSKGNYSIGDIRLQSVSKPNSFSAVLSSEFAHAQYEGSEIFTDFIRQITDNTLHKHLPNLFGSIAPKNIGKNGLYSFKATFYNTKAISELILPGFYLDSSSTISVNLNRNNDLKMELYSPKIGYKNSYGSNLKILTRSDNLKATSSLSSDKLSVSGVDLDNSKLDLKLSNNLLNLDLGYKNTGDYKSQLLFSSDINFSKGEKLEKSIIDILIKPSQLQVNNQIWNFSKSSISISDSTYNVKGLRIYNSSQELSVNGLISPKAGESLVVNVNNFDITPINLFIKKKFDIKGYFTGNVKLVDYYKSPQISANLHGSDVVVFNHAAGEIDLESEWDNSEELFNVNIKNKLEGKTPLEIKGYYKPKGSTLNLAANFNDMSVAYFEPFLSDIFIKTSGTISGDIILKGPTNKLLLTSSNTVLNDFGLTVKFTNVHYLINGPVNLTESSIKAKNAIIKDKMGNIGYVNGGLTHNYFSNLALNTNIDFKNLECINTQEKDNPAFYGSAYATGSVNISGPLNKILIDINATTNKSTSIHIPISSTAEATKTNLLTFIEPKKKVNYGKDSGNIFTDGKSKTSTELIVKLKANVTPDASMLIEINKEVGDIITGYGSGLINLEVNPTKDIFSIHGDFFIDRGDYQFGYALKKFNINQGGNINFNGDILSTKLNLTASYKTKASINTLISDTSSVGNRRTIDCQIMMSGPLMNPSFKFNIDIPDIDPTTKARVNTALNTEDKMVRQVMSILVTGSFVPDMQSNIVNNTNILYSNLTEILSNQINNIFNQLEIPLDLNFNYQQATNGRDLFDAAISAQLLNNRVVINGNIGNSQYSNKSTSVVGDFEVEVKLDTKGKIRAKAFSKAADQYSNYLDGGQRNGLGLVYQEEFSSFRDLFNRIFLSKKRRALLEEKRAYILEERRRKRLK